MAIQYPSNNIHGAPGERWVNETDKTWWQLKVSLINSCGQCVQYANTLARFWPVPFHPGCNCRSVPVTPGQRAEPFLDFREEIRQLPESQQSSIMGAANYELVQKGVVQWEDVVGRSGIKPFWQVVQKHRLSVDTLTKAGIPRSQAEQTLARLNSPEQLALQQKHKAIYDQLLAAGLTPEQIRDEITKRLAARFGLVGKPNPPGSPLVVIKPTPPPGGGGSRGAAPGAGPGPKPAPKPTPGPKTVPVVNAGSNRTPLGTPVSNSLIIPPEHQARFGPVMKSIDRVHGDGVFPRIPLIVDATQDLESKLSYIAKRGRPIHVESITVGEHGIHPELTLVHEIGHRIDVQGIPDVDGQRLEAIRNYVKTPILLEWKQAVDESPSIKQLKYLVRSGSLPQKDDGYARYLLNDYEIWARSYAQYIATRSGNTRLVEQVRKILALENQVLARRQWSDQFFEPIGKSIDRIFLKLGWVQ